MKTFAVYLQGFTLVPDINSHGAEGIKRCEIIFTPKKSPDSSNPASQSTNHY
jgi:hypothetical protein